MTKHIRRYFEAIFSDAPFEFNMERWDENGSWPGNYKDYNVQCAWEGFSVAMELQLSTPPGQVLVDPKLSGDTLYKLEKLEARVRVQEKDQVSWQAAWELMISEQKANWGHR